MREQRVREPADGDSAATIRRRLHDLLDGGVGRGPVGAGEPRPERSGSADDEGGEGPGASDHARPGKRAAVVTRPHLLVAVAIALAGCVWAASALLSARTVPVAITRTTPATATGFTRVTSATPSAQQQLLVHVLGAVRRPGLIRLAPGARVADAIEAAGGLRPGARPGELNLAALIADGSQIVIGDQANPGGELRAGAGGAGVAGQPGASKVNLNTATVEQLETLPGVGPVTAQAIVSYRAGHRFTRVEELQEVEGIGPKTYAKLAPLVTA